MYNVDSSLTDFKDVCFFIHVLLSFLIIRNKIFQYNYCCEFIFTLIFFAFFVVVDSIFKNYIIFGRIKSFQNYFRILIFKSFKVFVYLKCCITVNLSSIVINHLFNIYSKYIIILVKCFSQKYKKILN